MTSGRENWASVICLSSEKLIKLRCNVLWRGVHRTVNSFCKGLNMEVSWWPLILSEAVYGNIVSLPGHHQQKTKSKHGSSLIVAGCGPLLTVLLWRACLSPGYMEEEEAWLLGKSSSIQHLCRKGLIKRCGEQILEKPYTSHGPNIWCRVRHSQPYPSPCSDIWSLLPNTQNALK